MTTFNINSLSINQKRDLVKALREAIKEDTLTNKRIKVLSKQRKEQEKKIKLENAIKAATEKLAKLQAKLA